MRELQGSPRPGNAVGVSKSCLCLLLPTFLSTPLFLFLCVTITHTHIPCSPPFRLHTEEVLLSRKPTVSSPLRDTPPTPRQTLRPPRPSSPQAWSYCLSRGCSSSLVGKSSRKPPGSVYTTLGLNCVPPNSYIEVPTSGTSESNSIWR